MPANIRNYFEPRFGADFSAVRLHRDPSAAAAAEAANANAFTIGQHIAFNESRFAPGTAVGRQLLGHELAHVVQQKGGGAAPEGEASSPPEQEARLAGHAAATGAQTIPVRMTSGVGMARDEKEDEDRVKRDTGLANQLYSSFLASPIVPAFAKKNVENANEWVKREAPKYGVSTETAQKIVSDAVEVIGPANIQTAQQIIDPKAALANQPAPTASPTPPAKSPASQIPGTGATAVLPLVGTQIWTKTFWSGFSAVLAGDASLQAGLAELNSQLDQEGGKAKFAGGLTVGVPAGALTGIANLAYEPFKLYMELHFASMTEDGRRQLWEDLKAGLSSIVPNLAKLLQTDPAELGRLAGQLGSGFIQRDLLLAEGGPSLAKEVSKKPQPVNPYDLTGLILPSLSTAVGQLLSYGPSAEANQHVYNKGLAIGQVAGEVLVNLILAAVGLAELAAGASVTEAIRGTAVFRKIAELVDSAPRLKALRRLRETVAAVGIGLGNAAPDLVRGAAGVTDFADIASVSGGALASSDAVTGATDVRAASSLGDLSDADKLASVPPGSAIDVKTSKADQIPREIGGGERVIRDQPANTVDNLMQQRAAEAILLRGQLQARVNGLNQQLYNAVKAGNRAFLERYLTSKAGKTGRVEVLLNATDPQKANIGLAQMIYGQALEAMLAEDISADPNLASKLTYTANESTYAGGKKPDFNISNGPLKGWYVDLTTDADAGPHALRGYGERQTIHLKYTIGQ